MFRRKRTASTPTPKTGRAYPAVPNSAIWVARTGGSLALLSAAAISAQTLYFLARMMGLGPNTAWLLPAALDVYAFTSTVVAYLIPGAHPARSQAMGNARVALSFTVGANVIYHALYLADHGTGWSVRDVVLTALSALPPVVVERLLHLQAMLAGNGTHELAADAAPRQKSAAAAPARPAVPSTPAAQSRRAADPAAPGTAEPTAAPESGQHGGTNNVIAIGNGTRSMPEWAAIAAPLWLAHEAEHGRPPTANQLAEALAAAGERRPGERNARNIRAATQALIEAGGDAPGKSKGAEGVAS